MKVVRDFFTLVGIMFKWFPKFFSPIANFIPWIGPLIAYLPEIIDILKLIKVWANKGMTKLEIKRKLKQIDEAFEVKDAQDRAKALDGVFRL